MTAADFEYIHTEDLPERLSCTTPERDHVLRTGLLRATNFAAFSCLPCFLTADLQTTRAAIREARATGQPLGQDYREPGRTPKDPDADPLPLDVIAPEEMESDTLELERIFG